MKPRLGFLGVGWIGRHRMEMIEKSGFSEVSMVYDPSPKVMEEALKMTKNARPATCFEELLEADLEGIVIATPSALHAEQSIRALERGKAVFCQKPLGRTANEARKVVDLAQKNHLLLGVDFSYRYTESMQKIRNLLLENDIGEVFCVDLTFHNAYGPDKPWFYNPQLSGGGCVMDLGVHLVDLALWVMGFPKVHSVTSRLYSEGKLIRKQLNQMSEQVEDYGIARLDLANGTTIQLSCSWRLSAGCDCVLFASFYGTRGSLVLKNVNGSFYDFVAERNRGTTREILVQPPDAWGGRAAVDWARRLGNGLRFDPDSLNLIHVAEALDSIYGR